MPERSTLLQRNQIGVESTPGTAVAANKALLATAIALSPTPAIGTFRPKGYKFNTLTLPGSEWVEGDVEGRLSYTDVLYILASILDTPPAPTQPDVANAPSVYLWEIDPSSTAEDDPTTYTVEEGSTVRAHRSAFILFTEFGFDFNRQQEDGIEISGSVLGKKLEDGVTLTATPTEIAAQPVLPQHFTVYADDTSAGLGTTKLNRVLQLGWQISTRFAPVWVIDASEDSYVEVIEAEPEFTVTLMLEADAEGMGYLANARAGDTKFLRLEAVGPTIEDVQTYKFVIDCAAKISEVGDFSDEDGIYAIEFTFTNVHDSGWGKALHVEVQNTLDAL